MSTPVFSGHLLSKVGVVFNRKLSASKPPLDTEQRLVDYEYCHLPL